MKKYLEKLARWATKVFTKGVEDAVIKEAADEIKRREQGGQK